MRRDGKCLGTSDRHRRESLGVIALDHKVLSPQQNSAGQLLTKTTRKQSLVDAFIASATGVAGKPPW